MSDLNIKKHLIVAMDVSTEEEALKIATEIEGSAEYLKIGKQLFTKAGPSLVKKLKDKGFKIFLDLKFHDIPNTVAKAAIEATRLGVDMFNIHASGGSVMMETTVKEVTRFCVDQEIARPAILGVTVLTSMSDEDLSELGCGNSVQKQVELLGRLSKRSGLDGVVASAKEVELIRKVCGNKFVIVTPGVRPAWAASDDQKRVVTPKQAITNGSDYIVIGRPILKAESKKEAIEKLLDE